MRNDPWAPHPDKSIDAHKDAVMLAKHMESTRMIAVDDVLHSKRGSPIVCLTRQCIYYALNRRYSQEVIATAMMRNRASISTGKNKIAKLMLENEFVKQAVQELLDKLGIDDETEAVPDDPYLVEV